MIFSSSLLSLVVVARVEVQLVAAEGRDLGHLGDVARGLLDAVDQGVGAELLGGLGGDVDAGPGGDVIEDHRDAAGLGHGGKVGHQARLAGLVVVGGDHQQSVGAAVGGPFGQGAAVGGVVGAGPPDLPHPMGHGVHRVLDGGELLGVHHGGALAGGAADDDGVGAPGDLVLEDPAQLFKVDAAVLVHGGDDGHARTGKNRLLHSVKGSFRLCI